MIIFNNFSKETQALGFHLDTLLHIVHRCNGQTDGQTIYSALGCNSQRSEKYHAFKNKRDNNKICQQIRQRFANYVLAYSRQKHDTSVILANSTKNKHGRLINKTRHV